MLSEQRGFILIVDDTPTNLAVISDTLSDAGYEVAVATSGERALKQIKRRQPELILLDVMMPGIDGFETCRQLQADPQYCEIPIIFITALADIDNKVRGFGLGAVDYITKPFQEQEVLARVGTHLKLKRTQRKLDVSEARLEKILNALDEVVWSATCEPFQLLQISPAVTRVCAMTADELIQDSSPFFALIPPEVQAAMQAQQRQVIASQHWTCEYQIATADGGTRWLQSKIHGYYCTHRQQYMVDGITCDISDRKQVEAKLNYAATHDSLTGLVNRQHFLQMLNNLLAERSTRNFTVLFIDLDRFKIINDSHGHQQGDQILKRVANVLCQSLRPQDVVARLGGDEFTVLLPDVSREEEIQVIVQRLQARLERGFAMSEQAAKMLTASIGVAIGSAKYTSAHDLLRDADIAMYQAKKLGKDGYQVFNRAMYEATVAKITLEQELRSAIQQGVAQASTRREERQLIEQARQHQLSRCEPSPYERDGLALVYQPIYQPQAHKLFGFEALLRWRHPDRGMISPVEFIPLAEQTGLIVPLGEQVLWEALTQLRDWQQRYPAHRNLTMSINLSIRQLQEPNFLATVDRLLQEIKIAPNCIKLEITESLLMQSGDIGFSRLNDLCARGFSLSLDDFGTGYSSLSYLHHFPINTLKLDQSFIQKLGSEPSSRQIVQSMTGLAHSLGIDVVAEGVETTQQLVQLQQLACDMVQGYLFAKPLEPEAAEAYLASDKILQLLSNGQCRQ